MSVSPETPKAENKTIGAKSVHTQKGGGARNWEAPVPHWEGLARPPPPGYMSMLDISVLTLGRVGVLPLHLMPNEGGRGTSRGPFGELDASYGV